jgi:hypothetical protein
MRIDKKLKPLLTSVLIASGIACFLLGIYYHLMGIDQSSEQSMAAGLLVVDQHRLYLPLFTFAKKSILSGSFPLWNPYQALGNPFFARIQLGLLYPVNWMIFALDVPRAMLAIQGLNTSIGMMGTILYLRYLKVEWPPIALASVLFGYCVLAQSFVLPMGSSLCWLPLILWAAQKLFDEPGFRMCSALAILLALCFLGGFFQYFFYTCILVPIYFLSLALVSLYRKETEKIWVKLGLFACAFFLGIGLVCVQFLPTMELSINSTRDFSHMYRGEGLPWLDFSIIHMVKGYLKKEENLIYFGGSLFFMPFALASRKNRPAVIGLLAALAYSILFLKSRYVPALAIFGRIPFADSFRGSYRMLDMGHYMIAALSAIGLSCIWDRAPLSLRLRDSQSNRVNWFWPFVIISLLALSYLSYAAMTSSVGSSPLRLAIFPVAVMLVLLLLSRPSRFSSRAKLNVALIVAALILLDVVSNRWLEVKVPAAVEDSMSDLFRAEIARVKSRAEYNRILFQGNRNPNLGSEYEFFDINDYGAFPLGRWRNYLRFMIGAERFDGTKTWAETFSGHVSDYPDILDHPKMMGLVSFRYLVFEKRGERPELDASENAFALPRAYMVSDYLIADSEDESLRKIRENIQQMAHTVVLEGGRPSFSPMASTTGRGQVRIENYGINEVELEVDSTEPAIVILTDAYYPGWKAYLDAEEKPVWRANSLFRAVETPPGNHRLVFRYQPDSVRLGIIVSLASLLLMFLGLAWEHILARRLSES